MTTPRRPPITHRWWFWLALALIAVFAFGSVATANRTPTTEPPAATTTVPGPESNPDPLTDEGWTASDIRVIQGEYGTEITATVTNEQTYDRSGVFTLTFVSDGRTLGTATGAANNVQPGQAATVRFLTTDQIQVSDTFPAEANGTGVRFQADF